MKEKFRYLVISFFCGITGVIPGVSGGTIFTIFGISEELTTSIKNLSLLKFKGNVTLPLIIGLGTLISSIIYANLFISYFDKFEVFIVYLFIGLVIFSLPILLNESKTEKLSKRILLFFIGFLISVSIFYLSNNQQETVVNISSPIYYIKYFIINFINGMTMIIPGISGTNILIMFGEYGNYLTFTSNFLSYPALNLIFLLAIVLGSIMSSFLLSFIFKNYYSKFFAIMAGLTFSTIIYIYESPFNNLLQAILGFSLAIIILKVIAKKQKDDQNKNIKK